MYGMLKAEKKQKINKEKWILETLPLHVGCLLPNALKHALPYTYDLVLLYR